MSSKTVDYPKLLICLIAGLSIKFIPTPEALTETGWNLLALFITTILGIILQPLPLGGVALLSFAVLTTCKLIPIQEAFYGFGNPAVWLVLMAVFIAKGFILTGLGPRIGYFFTWVLGKRTLGLSYGLAASDLIMAPAIPSVTARSAGIVYPIAQSIARNYQSFPNSESKHRVGEFLTLSVFQVTVITSAMFMTAMAANPLISELVADQGYNLDWITWAKGAIVPGLVSLIATPWLIFKLVPPTIQRTDEATEIAKSQLKQMGKLSRPEWIMAFTVLLLLVLWIFGEFFQMKAVVAAFIGMSILIATGVLNWKDLAKEGQAWETFFWFSILILLAKSLTTVGVTAWFTQQCTGLLPAGVSWQIALASIILIYFVTHYFFASSVAHVSAMFIAFLLIAIQLGTPPMMAILSLAYCSNLYAGLTHYSFTPAPLLFSAGYVDMKTWWKIGLLVGLFNLGIWSVVGSTWWKLLGIW